MKVITFFTHTAIIKFNLAFGGPRIDVLHVNLFRGAAINKQKYNNLNEIIAKKYIHKLKAKAFHEV